METHDHIEAYKAFGAAVLGGAKPGTIEVPTFDRSADDEIKLYDTILESKDQETVVGFAYALNKQISRSFEKYSDDDKGKIKSSIMKLTAIKNKEAINGLIAAFDTVYNAEQGKWDELINFIFDEDKSLDYIRGHLFAALDRVRDPEFAEENKEKMIKTLHRLLLSKEDVPKEMFLLLVSLCKPSDEDFEKDKNLINDIWKIAIDYVDSDEKNEYETIFVAMNELFSNQAFKKAKPDVVIERVNEFIDASSDFEARISAISPIFKLFPFLNDDLITTVIFGNNDDDKKSLLDDLQNNYFEASILLGHLEESNLDLLSDDTVMALYAIIEGEFSGERRNAALAFCQPFVDRFVDLNEEATNSIIKIIIENLNSDNFSSTIACQLLTIMTERFESINQDLFNALAPKLIINDDENLFTAAHKAMRALLDTSLYSTEANAKALIELYPKFEKPNLQMLSKLLVLLLTSADDPGLSLVDPVFEFALPLIGQSKEHDDNALGLDLFAVLGDISPDYIEDNIDDAMDVAIKILNSKDTDCYRSAALYLSAMSDMFKERCREKIMSQVDYMMSIVKGSIKVENKQLIGVTIAVSEIAARYDIRDLAFDLVEYARTQLINNVNIKIARNGADVIQVLSKSLLSPNAIDTFSSLAETIDTISDADLVNTLLIGMKQMMKKYKVSFNAAILVIEKLFNGKLEAVPEISLIEDSETSVFSFIKGFIKKYKKQAEPYCHQLIANIPIIAPEVLPNLLDPIETAIELKLFDEETISKFNMILSGMLMEQEDSPTATSLLTTIVAIKRNYPTSMNTKAILQTLTDLWEGCDEDEDFELPMAIAMLTFEICADKENGDDLDPRLVLDLLDILPLPPDFCDLKHVIDAIIKMSELDWVKSSEILQSIAELMAKILLMKKQKIDEYELEAGVMTALKAQFKKIAHENPKIKEHLVQIANDKQNVITLTALFK